jgi:LEA14-like dessication related protein
MINLRKECLQLPALLLLCLIGLTACATLGEREQRLKVTMSSIIPLESTLMEQRYLIKLRIQNRSNKPLTIDGVSFDLELNGKAFASGVSNQQANAAAYGEALLEVKVSSTIFGVIRQIQSIQELGGKPFEYQISGNLSTPDSFFNLPFRESGEIDIGPQTRH